MSGFDFRVIRPWWWWINPWLYIKRRDRAYEDAICALHEQSIERNDLRGRVAAMAAANRLWFRGVA